VHKKTIDVVSNLGALEKQVVVYKWHDNDVQDLKNKFQRGDLHKGLQSQPFLPIESLDPIPKTWVTLDKCSFCGLGLAFVWTICFAYCKHVYQEWCAMYHFGNSSK
jgi:hypothetical protein